MKADIAFSERWRRLQPQMALGVCSGCDQCGIRCEAGVPASQTEWETLQAFLDSRTQAEREEIARVELQDKTVDLGDDIKVKLCRYRDMEKGCCMVYPARPLVCRLLGHVEWMPCPIEKVPHTLPTNEALELMRCYADLERHTFEEWEQIKQD